MGSLSFLPGRLVLLVEANSLQNSQYLGKQPEQGCAILRYCGPSGQDNGWGQTTFLVLALFPKLLDIRNESRNTQMTFQYTIKVMIDTTGFMLGIVLIKKLLEPKTWKFCVHKFILFFLFQLSTDTYFQLIFFEAKWPALPQNIILLPRKFDHIKEVVSRSVI